MSKPWESPGFSRVGAVNKWSNNMDATVKKYYRTATIRLDPSDETWRLLRKRASEAAAYRNKFMQAYLADALKWRTPEWAEKDKIQKVIRATEVGDLSSSVYVACESEVKKDWQRDGRKIMAGARMPQYGQMDSLAFATISSRPGVTFHETESNIFEVRLMLSAKHVDGGCWVSVPVSRRTKKDEFRLPFLHDLAAGNVPVQLARVKFMVRKGLTLLQISYPVERAIAAVGERSATLSEFSDRLLLRSDCSTLDFTYRLTTIAQRKTDWDAIRRRVSAQIGRRKGGARAKRRVYARMDWSAWLDTYLHTWSREVVEWLKSEGCADLHIVLTGGDWPAHKLVERIKYKADACGIAVTAATKSSESAERAASAAITKERTKARKLGDAVREIQHQIGG